MAIQQHQRLISLDVLRGLTIALMILVNTPGSWSHVYAPFLHAKWHGCTLTDLVFPSFTFIVGVSMVFSLGKFGWSGQRPDGVSKPLVLKVIKRTVLIFLVGVLLNYFPFYDTSLGQLRIYGVLQRIALAYGFSAFLVVWLSPKQWAKATLAVMLGYWGLLAIVGEGAFALETNLKRTVDLATIGAKHMYGGFGVPFDPEGLIGLFGTAGNILLGAIAGHMIQRQTNHVELVKQLLIFGVCLIVVGKVFGLVVPINKPLWTPSYAIYTSGIAACALGVLMELIDVRSRCKWAEPFLDFGVNPLAIYALSSLLTTSMYAVVKWTDKTGATRSLYDWLFNDFWSSIVPIPKLASLLFALSVVSFCWGVAWKMRKAKIFVKL